MELVPEPAAEPLPTPATPNSGLATAATAPTAEFQAAQGPTK
jgi:hypothetical protein